MDPKEKAKSILQKYEGGINGNTDCKITPDAKFASIICVNEIIEVLKGNHIFNSGNIEYWTEVKEEISKY